MGAHLEWIGRPRPPLEGLGAGLDLAGGTALPLRVGCASAAGFGEGTAMAGDVISLDEHRRRASRAEPGWLARVALQLAVLLGCLAMLFGKIP